MTLFSVAIAAFSAFVATNLDDILVLMLFFSQVNASSETTMQPRHIIVGQYLGFVGLIGLSLPGFVGGRVLPEPWIGLLGLLPIVLGVRQLMQRGDAEEGEIQTVSDAAVSTQAGRWGFNPLVYKVAMVTIANGGDNISIYVPLFASTTWLSLGVTLTIFLGMVWLWCALARYLTAHPAIAPLLTRYGNQVIPYVFIALGVFILLENQTFQMFY